MAVAFDAVGAGQNGGGAGPLSLSFAHTAASGADVFLGILVDRDITPSSVDYNGVAMTLVGSQIGDNSATFGGVAYLYRAVAAGTGSAANCTASIPTSFFAANSVSYTSVSSIGSPAYTFGQSKSPASSSVSCTTGQMIIGLVGICDDGQAGTLGSPTGGTNRYLCGGVSADTSGSSGLAISDSTSTATFAGTVTGSGTPCWSTISLVLSPPAGTTVTPTTATVHVTGGTPTVLTPTTVSPATSTVDITGGTPAVTVAGSGALSPASAQVTITPGTPTVLAPLTVTPTSTTVHITGGTPASAEAYGPLAPLLNKLSLGQSVSIQTVGDSTCYGSFDTGFSSSNGQQGFTPNASTGVFCGWAGRMAIALGEYFNANVVINLLAMTAGATINTKWSFPSGTVYDSPVTLFTASGGGRPTITLWHYGWPGGTMADTLANMAAIFQVSNSDIVILNDGFNETSVSTFGTNLATFVSDVQSTYCPGAPILVNTQNATTLTTNGVVTFANIGQEIVDVFISGSASLPLSPPLQASTTAGVWVLDTRQAGQIAATLNTDGLHPIAPGYAEQAQFMLNNLTSLPGLVEDAGLFNPSTATVTITPGTPTDSVSTGPVETPATATVHVTGGTPGVTATANVTDAPATATVHVSGHTPTVTNSGASPGAFITPPSRIAHVPANNRVVKPLAYPRVTQVPPDA